MEGLARPVPVGSGTSDLPRPESLAMTSTLIATTTLKSLIRDVHFTMLTTRGPEGDLHSRPMVVLEGDSDDRLWFFTDRSSSSSTDVSSHPQVNLTYSDAAANHCISVSGTAELVEDRDRIRALWHHDLAIWFPKGVEDPDIVLLKVTVDRADHWHSSSTWITRTLAFAKALVGGESSAHEPSVKPQPHLSPASLINGLQWRYAVKQFDSQRKIPSDVWDSLEQSLVLSPSSYGLQPWRFLVVTDPSVRERLLWVSRGQRQVVDSSHLVVLAARTDITHADVSAWIARITEVRQLLLEELSPLSSAITNDLVTGPRHAVAAEWAKHQTYLALGVFLTSAALMGIDACPMEGFEPKGYDEILGLAPLGYTASVIVTAGYRSPDDYTARALKVRQPATTVLLRL